MKASQDQLIKELINMTSSVKAEVVKMKEQPLSQLNLKQSAESWSALECLEHLNRYGDFYLPEITRRINASKHPNAKRFKSSWLGEYFANAMKPDAKSMQTFKVMNPVGSELDKTVIDTFIQQQDTLLDLLEAAQTTSLQKIKTSISISKMIRLRLGDTFRVLIYHNERHLAQAKRAVDAKK